MEGSEDTGSRSSFGVSLPVSEFSHPPSESVAPLIPPAKVYCHALCQMCGDTAKEPILNIVCGHLFCWCCIYKFSKKSDFGERCPKCSSHMDISRGTGNATIISVYSGPEPGIYYDWRDSEPEEDEEDEDDLEKPKEEALSHVPPRPPMWNGGCMHPSAVLCVGWLLHRLNNIVKLRVKPHLEVLCRERDHDLVSVARRVAREVSSCINYLQKGLQWAHGEKTGCDSINPKESPGVSEPHQQHFDHNSQIACFNFSSGSTFCCKICCAPAYEPVATRCGHLFCWSCLYLNFQNNPSCNSEGFYCPVCKLFFVSFNGRVDMNPIYYDGGLCPEMEDELLMRGRRFFYHGKNNIDQILSVPRRTPPTLALRFLHRMLDAYVTQQTQIKKRFDKFLDGSKYRKNEDGKLIAKEIEEGLNLLHNQLTEEWKKELSENETSKCVLEDKVLDLLGPKWNMSYPNDVIGNKSGSGCATSCP